MTNWKVRSTLAALIVAACVADLSWAGRDEGYVKLFNGKNLNGWFRVLADAESDPDQTWSVRDGVLICTGSPNGYIMTKDRWKGYTLRLQWRYASSGDPENPFKLGDQSKDSGNSGVLLHCQPPFNVWPTSIEVQLANSRAGSIFPIPEAKSENRTSAQGKARPVGQWNSLEITCQDDTVRVELNGEPVGTVTGCNPSSGHISFQSEGAEIHFRNIEIKLLQ